VIEKNLPERGQCLSDATASCSCGHFTHILRASGAHALSSLVGYHCVMNGLGALPVLDERELDLQFALVISFGIFNGKLHS
jgi:hypothetical protein